MLQSTAKTVSLDAGSLSSELIKRQAKRNNVEEKYRNTFYEYSPFLTLEFF